MGIYVRGKDFYPAIVTLVDGLFEAKFVDFPNCVAMGTSARLAEERAELALAIFLKSRRKWAKTVPAPSVVNDANAAHRYIAYIPSTDAGADA